MTYKSVDIIEYIIFMINEFAREFHLTEIQAYRYIKNHGGIDFIEGNYGIMHTLDDRDSLESIALFCKRNGGVL